MPVGLGSAAVSIPQIISCRAEGGARWQQTNNKRLTARQPPIIDRHVRAKAQFSIRDPEIESCKVHMIELRSDTGSQRSVPALLSTLAKYDAKGPRRRNNMCGAIYVSSTTAG